MLNSEQALTYEQLKRRVLFTPCETKQALHDWIEVFLDLDMPDCIVDPQSTSSPMDCIWEVYDHARRNEDPTYSRVLAYAARDSFKTLGAAILEVLVVMHLHRSVAHMAAIKPQAQNAQRYVKQFFSKPMLRDFKIGDNVERTEVVAYRNKQTHDTLSESEWSSLPPAEQEPYERIEAFIQIVVATMTGTNSLHVPFMVIDEVDVVPNPKAYEEAKMIPAPINGLMPITLLTSTRKFSFGLVQKELDEAVDDRGHRKLQVRHWNLIDVTQRCPEKRHCPPNAVDERNRKTRLPIYRSDDTLRSMSEADYQLLSPDQQRQYVRDEGYWGCLYNCRIFAACQGRLATCQTSNSPLLKPVEHTQNQFGHVSVETAKAQLLCWKPSSVGRVYPRFDREVHMISAPAIAQLLTGEKFPATFGKAELVEMFRLRGCRFSTGMDFGYTHLFAAITSAIDGNRCFVFDVLSVPEIETVQKIEMCDSKIKFLDPRIWPDTADPGSIKLFKKSGYRMMSWKKDKGSVVGGIEIVRAKLMPADGRPPELYFLQGDPGCELLAKRLCEYHWKLDAAGNATGEPDDADDDECDALRYLIMNEFKSRGRVTAAREDDRPMVPGAPVLLPPQSLVGTRQPWMVEAIQRSVGSTTDIFSSTGSTTTPEALHGAKGRKGSFCWDIE
jgi:hypothetical protein